MSEAYSITEEEDELLADMEQSTELTRSPSTTSTGQESTTKLHETMTVSVDTSPMLQRIFNDSLNITSPQSNSDYEVDMEVNAMNDELVIMDNESSQIVNERSNTLSPIVIALEPTSLANTQADNDQFLQKDITIVNNAEPIINIETTPQERSIQQLTLELTNEGFHNVTMGPEIRLQALINALESIPEDHVRIGSYNNATVLFKAIFNVKPTNNDNCWRRVLIYEYYMRNGTLESLRSIAHPSTNSNNGNVFGGSDIRELGELRRYNVANRFIENFRSTGKKLNPPFEWRQKLTLEQHQRPTQKTGEYKSGKSSKSTANLNPFRTYSDILQRQVPLPTVATSSQLTESELNHSIILSDRIRQQESLRLKYINDFNSESKFNNEQINYYSKLAADKINEAKNLTEKFNEKISQQDQAIRKLKQELDQVKALEAEREQRPSTSHHTSTSNQRRREDHYDQSTSNQRNREVLYDRRSNHQQRHREPYQRKAHPTALDNADRARSVSFNRMAQKINRDKSTGSNAGSSRQTINEERRQPDYSSQTGRKWLKDALLGKIQERLSTIPSPQQEGKSKVGINVLGLADFNEDTLNLNLPYEQPECMGKGWTEEAMSFDAKSLKVSQTLASVRASINRIVLETLDVNIIETSEYINVLEALSLQIEQLGVEVGFQVIGNNGIINGVRWMRPRGQASQRSTILAMIRQRSLEFSRCIQNHIDNVEELMNNQPLRDYVNVISDELPRLLNKLWWLANFNVPVSERTSW